MSNYAFCDGHVKFYKLSMDAITTRDQYNNTQAGRNALEGVLPWKKNGSPSATGNETGNPFWDNGN